MGQEIVWTKELTLLFIHLYETNECLYNPLNPDYVNKRKRACAYANILQELKLFCPDITLEAIKRKKHTLRNQFVRELRLLNKSKNSATGDNNDYEPKLWCFDELSFLRTHSTMKTPKLGYENQDANDNTSEASDNEQSQLIDSEETSTLKIKGVGWSKELTLKFIHLYETHENLYNPTHPDYKDRQKKADAFESILQMLKLFSPNVTIEAIKRKGYTLREQFMLELQKVEKSKSSGTGLGDIYKPKLWCYNELIFLKPHCPTRQTGFSFLKQNTNDNTSDESVTQQSHMDVSDEASAPKRRLMSPAENCFERFENIAKLLEQRLSNKSSFSWLGKQVEYEMGQIVDEDIKRKASWDIQKVLRDCVREDIAKRLFPQQYHQNIPAPLHNDQQTNPANIKSVKVFRQT